MTKAKNMGSNDGLVVDEVGVWAEDKYAKLSYYAAIVAKAMRNHWKTLVYVDLFCGPGRVRFRGSSDEFPNAAMRVVMADDPFDLYLLNDYDPEKVEAFRKRVARDAPDRQTQFFVGDANKNVVQVLNEIPRKESLSLFFLDPYGLSSLKFTTLNSLAKRTGDFLMLVPTEMDINRNEFLYSGEKKYLLDEYIGEEEWLEARRNDPNKSFGTFIAERIVTSFNDMGFLGSLADSVQIKNSRQAPIYRLVFLSKHETGLKFWRESCKRTTPQTALDFGD